MANNCAADLLLTRHIIYPDAPADAAARRDDVFVL